MEPSWLAFAAALQGACSLLIEVDDGIADDARPSLPGPGDEDGGGSDAKMDSNGAPPIGNDPSADYFTGDTRSGRTDAGAPPAAAPGDGGALPPAPPAVPFDLAFIEQRNDSADVLRIVSSRAALSSSIDIDDNPPWRRTLEPAEQGGDALDFAWAPGGERLAVRYSGEEGARIAFFAAPEWQELPLEDAGSPANMLDLSASANYRWAPDGRTLAVELTSDEGPYVAGYTVSAEGARRLPLVELAGPIETMNWVSSDTLFVIQPDNEAPELLTYTLNGNAFGAPENPSTLSLPSSPELRRVPGGLIGASLAPGSSLFFWPEFPELSRRSYSPTSYLSATPAIVAEPDDSTGTTFLSALGGSQLPLDELPDCPIVLAWADGPEPSSLAASKIACLRSLDAGVAIDLYTYDAGGARAVTPLGDPRLVAAYATQDNWFGHARGFSASGEFLALATAEQDTLIDLRGSVPSYHIAAAAAAVTTARGFSPSGRYLIRQRDRRVSLVALPLNADDSPLALPLADSAVDLTPCDSAPLAANWCGAPQTAALAGARWSSSDDVAVFLSAERGLSVLAMTEDSVSAARQRVSACETACVTQYQFGR